MPTRNINLTEHFDAFVANQVNEGKYRNASEVMRAGLQLLEQRSEEEAGKIALLKQLAAKGFDQLDQGKGIVIEGKELAEYIGKLGRRASALAKRRSQSA